MRPETEEGSRPNIGRKKKVPEPTGTSSLDKSTTQSESDNKQEYYETLSGKKTHPGYLEKGPLYTKEMWDKWTPEMLNINSSNTRPVRSTRNPNPQYKENNQQ